jgi:hypothetical protein
VTDDETPIADWLRENYGHLDVERPGWGTVWFALAQLALGFVFGVVVATYWIVDAAEEQPRFADGPTVFEITASGVADAVWPLVAVGTFWFATSALVVIYLDLRADG